MPIPNQRFAASLRGKVDRHLRNAKIWEMSSYGWTGADDYDPEYIGHAMWQTHPPLGWSFVLGDGPPPSFFPDWKKAISIAGADFEGLMAAARLSIGLALVHQPATEASFFGYDNFFELHVMSAMITLGSACDRIRDLFAAAVFEMDPGAYTRKWPGESSETPRHRRKNHYVAPFEDAPARLQGGDLHPRVELSLAALPALAERLQSYRDERNRLVHDLATEMGQRERHLVMSAEKRPDDDGHAYEQLISDERKQGFAAVEDAHRIKVRGEIAKPIEWYKLLIEAANDVFIVQFHANRQSEAAQAAIAP